MTIRTALFWVAAACCVFAEIAILRSLLVGRARKAELQNERGAVVGRSSRPVEVAWALLPAVGLLVVLYLTWRAVEQPSTRPLDIGRASATIGA